MTHTHAIWSCELHPICNIQHTWVKQSMSFICLVMGAKNVYLENKMEIKSMHTRSHSSSLFCMQLTLDNYAVCRWRKWFQKFRTKTSQLPTYNVSNLNSYTNGHWMVTKFSSLCIHLYLNIATYMLTIMEKKAFVSHKLLKKQRYELFIENNFTWTSIMY